MNAEVRKLEDLLLRIQTNRTKPRTRGNGAPVALASEGELMDHPPFSADTTSAATSTLVEETMELSASALMTTTTQWSDATETTPPPPKDNVDAAFDMTFAEPPPAKSSVPPAPDSLFPPPPVAAPSVPAGIVPVPMKLSQPALTTKPVATVVGSSDVRGPRTFGEWVRRSLALRVR